MRIRQQISVTLEPDVLKTIDDQRGLISRATLINDILKRSLIVDCDLSHGRFSEK